MAPDWKDVLKGLADSGSLPEGDVQEINPRETTDSGMMKDSKPAKDKLHVLVEKKGRKGKVATIIEGFTCSEEELLRIASTLKQKLGVGGSARGGEILIQGNMPDKVKEILKNIGLL
ncbi:MAG: translation initiation factor [Candidatus Amulumruptor caecigallinarius]|nr:translation initiation factor [Candidatus Amulumruptor caecigallinarius]